MECRKKENTAPLRYRRLGSGLYLFRQMEQPLASGSASIVELWDVVEQDRIATLEEYGGVNSVSFSRDGSILASGAFDSTIKLWNVFTRENIAILPNTDIVSSVSFSPDGRTLASGASDGTITLWDISEWTRPHPFALEIVSGDGQQGVPGTVLAHPPGRGSARSARRSPTGCVRYLHSHRGRREAQRAIPRRACHHRRWRAGEDSAHPGSLLWCYHDRGLPRRRELAVFQAEGVGTAVAELGGTTGLGICPIRQPAVLERELLAKVTGRWPCQGTSEYLAVASNIGVWLYEVATFRALALLPTESSVYSVAFSLDGSLAGGLGNGQVELWEVKTGTRVGRLRHADWGPGQFSSLLAGWEAAGFGIVASGH